MPEQRENSGGEDARLARVPPALRPHAFKRGQSGNPKGRPPGTGLYALMARLAVADALDRQLDLPADSRKAPPLRERVAHTLLSKAMGGHFRSMKLVLDLVDGPVR